jgi:hypothetical protein
MTDKLNLAPVIILLIGLIVFGCSDQKDVMTITGPDGDLISGKISAFVYDSVIVHSWDSTSNHFISGLRGARVYCFYPHPEADGYALISCETDYYGSCIFDLEIAGTSDTISVFAETQAGVTDIERLTLSKDNDELYVALLRASYTVPADCTSVIQPIEHGRSQ